MLIDAERNLYAQAEVESGQLRDMRVVETGQEAQGILSIVMQPVDGRPTPQFQPGSTLRITHPFGEFTSDTESAEPIVLIAAGVGITPMSSVVNRIAEAGLQDHVIFAYAGRDQAHRAHRGDIHLL
jgi:ferredoxin-NADP reductase